MPHRSKLASNYDKVPTDDYYNDDENYGDSKEMHMLGGAFHDDAADSLYETFVIDNARNNRGGYKSAVLRLLVALAFLALGVMFFFFAGFNLLNTRLDYNTDFSHRRCRLTSSDSCQERDLRRDHAVDFNWIIAAAYFSIGFLYFWVASMLWGIHLGATHSDTGPNTDAWRKGLINRMRNLFSIREARRPSEVMSYMSWSQSMQAAIAFVEDERMNGFTINHNVVHIIFDTLVFPILLASLGVRDFWKLMLFGALAMSTNLFLWYVQMRHRTPWMWGEKKNLNIMTKKQSRTGTIAWLGLCAYFVLSMFIWTVFLIYFVKFPHKSRTWYMILNMIIVLCYIPLHTLYQLGYYASMDLRVGARDANPFSVIAMVARIPFYVFPGVWMMVGTQIAIILAGPFLVMSLFYLVVRLAGYAYRGVDRAFNDPEMYPGISGRSALDMFFTLFDLLLAFVPIILLLGLDGHDNIAQIVFPRTQTYVY